jgi:hypothetical protein
VDVGVEGIRKVPANAMQWTYLLDVLMWGKPGSPRGNLERGMRRWGDRDCFLFVFRCIFIDRYGLLLSWTVNQGDRSSLIEDVLTSLRK